MAEATKDLYAVLGGARLHVKAKCQLPTCGRDDTPIESAPVQPGVEVP